MIAIEQVSFTVDVGSSEDPVPNGKAYSRVSCLESVCTKDDETYLASTILPGSFDIAKPRRLPSISCRTKTRMCDQIELTLQLLIQHADRDNDTLDVLAVIQVLFGLLVAFLQLNFHSDHLCNVRELAFTCELTSVSCPQSNAYLHVGVGQPGIADDGRAAIDNLLKQRTTMLALVIPGWLLRVGLKSLTYHFALAGSQQTIASHARREETHLAGVPSLLLELSHSSFLRRLALVNQAGGELDAEGLDGRAVLHNDHGADGLAGVLENRHDGDGVDACGLASLARGGFPDALLTVLGVD
jgi:hypothetical protein